MKVLSTLAFAAILSTSTGCAALIEAGIRSGDDDRRRGNYPSKSYGQHFLDASVGNDTRKRRRAKRTRVVVCHCHSPCHHG